MSVLTLRANAHLAIPVYATLLTGGPISYHVESELSTHVFAVDEAGLTAFLAGQNYRYWGNLNATSTPMTYHEYVGPTIPGSWYLLIVNYSPSPTAVYYRIPK